MRAGIQLAREKDFRPAQDVDMRFTRQEDDERGGWRRVGRRPQLRKAFDLYANNILLKRDIGRAGAQEPGGITPGAAKGLCCGFIDPEAVLRREGAIRVDTVTAPSGNCAERC